MLEIRLLGAFHIRNDGQDILISSPRQQALLSYLLLNPDVAHLRHHVAFQLWPDVGEAQARNSLRNLLFQLRQALPILDRYVHVDAAMIQWQGSAPYTCDVHQFRTSMSVASTTQDEDERQTALAAAAALYRGDLLPSCYDDWVLGDRAQIQRHYGAALSSLIDLFDRQHHVSRAVDYAERLVAHEPLDESAYRRLMRLHLTAGDGAATLRVYERCAQMLRAEFDVEPDAETHSVVAQAAVMRQEWTAAESHHERETSAAVLVGRATEWATLHARWQTTVQGQAGIVLLTGEAGIGKTRLAEEIFAYVHNQGFPTARTASYASGSDLAYAPVLAWLRSPAFAACRNELADVWLIELARLLPEIHADCPELPLPAPITDNWQRQRLLQALVEAIRAAAQPVLLFLDDIQWTDRETVQWLTYYLQLPPNPPALIVATLREEDLADHPWLPAVITEWRHHQLVTDLQLRRLSRAAAAQLADTVVGRLLDEHETDILFAETLGNPLFVVEMAHAVTIGAGEQPPPASHPGASSLPLTGILFDDAGLPPRVQSAIAARLERLSSNAEAVATLAAAVGASFTASLLATAAETDESSILAALDELWQRKVIHELAGSLAEPTFVFAHDKIRQFIYARTSAIRRRALHRSIGDALAAQDARGAPAAHAQIALHYELAGSLDRAVRRLISAGESAAQVHAYYRAEQHYTRALAIAGRLNLPTATLIQLYTERGRMLELAGDYPGAVAGYEEMDALAQRRGDRAMEAIAVTRLASCFAEPSNVHNQQMAVALFARGIKLAQIRADHELEARLLWSQMVAASHYGADEEAQRCGRSALAVARTHGLTAVLGYLLNDLAINLRLSGLQHEGQVCADEARALFSTADNLPMLADNLNQQAWHALHQLELDAAQAYAEEAAALSQRIENRWNQAFSALLCGIAAGQRGWWSAALQALEGCLLPSRAANVVLMTVYASLELGRLQRTLGLHEAARSNHQDAYDLCERKVPFLRHACAAQLALDAFAAGQTDAGLHWLHSAQHSRPAGAISRAWCVLADLAHARVCAAVQTGEWEAALQEVMATVAESEHRRLPIYAPTLHIDQARCYLALGQPTAAAPPLLAALTVAQAAGLTPLLWQAHTLGAEIARALGQVQEAAAHARAAQEAAARIASHLPADLSAGFLTRTAARPT